MESNNEVEINKEIMDYKESIVLGFNLRECFFSCIAIGIAILIYLNLKDIIGTEISSWLCILVALPFAGMAFIHYQGMSAEQIVIVAVRSYLLSKAELIDQPENMYYKLLKPYIELKRKESIKGYDEIS